MRVRPPHLHRHLLRAERGIVADLQLRGRTCVCVWGGGCTSLGGGARVSARCCACSRRHPERPPEVAVACGSVRRPAIPAIGVYGPWRHCPCPYHLGGRPAHGLERTGWAGARGGGGELLVPLAIWGGAARLGFARGTAALETCSLAKGLGYMGMMHDAPLADVQVMRCALACT